MPKRPVSLSVCGIIMIIFGAFGVLSLLRTTMMSSGLANMPGAAQNPALAAMNSPGFVAYMKLMTIPTVLGGALGIAAGIGMLKGREWGRKCGLFWTLWQVVAGAAGVWASFTYMVPMISKMSVPPGMKAEQAEMFRAIMSASITGGIVAGAIFTIALPVVIVILLTRRSVVDYCKRAPSVPPPLGA